ncbi:hypothetical protein KP509_13G041700 [Ceratopteris richardii]|uniref:Uncharacterized protein n=2 Tax=Ceratopteris richardii TaxID=49495 RepID=A0A8T2TF21_CERRI|nr:hypothetical protein KP509_13G041700 [Ceratopteris richardii]
MEVQEVVNQKQDMLTIFEPRGTVDFRMTEVKAPPLVHDDVDKHGEAPLDSIPIVERPAIPEYALVGRMHIERVVETEANLPLRNGVVRNDKIEAKSFGKAPVPYQSATQKVLIRKDETISPSTASGVEKQIISANGVSYYQVAFPDVLRPLSIGGDSNNMYATEYALHAYSVSYSILKEEQSPICNMPTTQFVLVNHLPLDEEVITQFLVRLNLPHQVCLAARLSPCGVVYLTSEQVKTAKLFNGHLFDFICGRDTRNKGEGEENRIKGFLILPLKDEVRLGRSEMELGRHIDWDVVLNFVRFNFNSKKRMSTMDSNSGPSLKLNMEAFDVKTLSTCGNEWLTLKSGVYREEDLLDAFVTFGPWGSSCFITGIARGLCALSPMEGDKHDICYRDYWLKRFNVELQYVSQPLLVGCSFSRTGNFLQRPSEAIWCSKMLKRVLLPPEVCLLIVGLKGTLWRGAFKLPSVLHGLENALLSAQLRDLVGVKVPVSKMQEALTSGAYNVYHSYERLELVGDSYLSLLGATVLYLENTASSKDDLASSLHSLVENKLLFRCAEASGIAAYVFNELFQIKRWIPPGLRFEKGRTMQRVIPEGQRISWRTLADVVEAIIGACVMYGRSEDAWKAVSWFGIPIKHPQNIACSHVFKSGVRKNQIFRRQMAHLEKHLQYKFKNHYLLNPALSCCSEEEDDIFQLNRLAFLGDCILSHHVAKHLLITHQAVGVGTINEIKQAVINKENLACAAIRNKLHGFIIGIDASQREAILAYATAVESECLRTGAAPAYGLLGLLPPKGLGDLVPGIAAAIYLDCGLDSDLVWKVIRPLLEPLPEPGTFSMHPIRELTEFCRARLLSLDIQWGVQNGMYEVNVIVNRERIARAEHEDKRFARKYAAVQALDVLQSSENKSWLK